MSTFKLPKSVSTYDAHLLQAAEIRRLGLRITALKRALAEAIVQLEYVNDAGPKRGTTMAVLVRSRRALTTAEPLEGKTP